MEDTESERKREFRKYGSISLIFGAVFLVICILFMPKQYFMPGWEGSIDPIWGAIGIFTIVLLVGGGVTLFLGFVDHESLKDWDSD